MYDSVAFTRSLYLIQLTKDVELIILVMFASAQVHVLQNVQMTVMGTGNVRRENVSAIRDSRVQTAVSVPKEPNVIKVSLCSKFIYPLADIAVTL